MAADRFSYPTVEQIDEGIKRLAKVVKAAPRKPAEGARKHSALTSRN